MSARNEIGDELDINVQIQGTGGRRGAVLECTVTMSDGTRDAVAERLDRFINKKILCRILAEYFF